ncbi:uncharacterized protein TRIVIDRAFT_39958 [Trichoderma virens Gv29-8]|uniref:F-box domain-containing protein n=1 Tax=Hypocrea virens (strain Gv29-8 / FGSC 10586) TaxID=413071 RepID=G9NBL3_HYPVG|nr:uncharacterized protein TRIVIDRAFT_39958 [Trichoderma virens Gv29-8]EHK16218.1 hypothetical protein TRIVIDRAFT_39958 [Trichoderma virens Gv29-8]UKZ56007.1 hypothetical protein TrVGV298_009831 [Trichoderma virens]
MSERNKRRKLNPDTESSPKSDTKHSPNIEHLPENILIQIITNLPGLDTLWNLLIASPRCYRLFNNQALTIIEQIFSSPNSILPPKIQEIVRAVILTRAGSLPFKSLDELRYQFIHHKLPLRIIKNRTCISFGSDSLTASDIPASIIRSVVATAHHISALTNACLSFYLKQVYDPSIFAPQHSQTPLPLYKIRGSNPPEGDKTPAWHEVFVGTPYTVVDAGPPSWVEEMRVTRAMWLIQLVGDVRSFVLSNFSTSGWSYDDINRTFPTSTAAFAQDGTMNSSAEEVRSVLEYLEKLGIQKKGKPFYKLPKLPPDAKPVNPVTPLPDPCEATWGGVGIWYNYGHKTIKLPPTPEARKRAKNPQLSEASLRGQTRASLESEAPALTMLRHFTEGRYGLPITNARFETYQPFGLAFWDKRRLQLLGLLGEGQQSERDLDFYCFAWESLMDARWVRHIMTVLRDGVGLENEVEGDGSGVVSGDDDDDSDEEE